MNNKKQLESYLEALEDATTHLNEAITCCEQATAALDEFLWIADAVEYPIISSVSLVNSLEDVEKAIREVRELINDEEMKGE